MKTLLMSIFCTFIGASLFAQVDSTNNMNNTNPTPQTTAPTMNTTNNTNNNMNDSTTNSTNNWNNTTNSDSSKAVTPPATQGTMNMNATNSDMNNTNSNMNSNSTSNMNMNSTTSNADSNLVNPNNIPDQVDYASLPVMETFVPQDVVAQVKEKFPNQVVYDITAVKAPVDSASMQNDSMMNHQNATAMNTDSSMNQNSTSMNQNSTTTQNSTMNMNQNGTNTNGMADTTQMPEKFDYVVRVLQNGQMTTETLESDGTAMLQPARSSGMNNDLNQ